MKKALKKLGAAVLAMAMAASLTPVTGFRLLADETETETPAATQETGKEKQEPAGKPDTGKQKDEDKPSSETPKETKEAETAAPKETEKPEAEKPEETEAPKETEADTPDETEAPKETEVPKGTEKAEVPQESEKPVAETSKESESSASNPKKNGTSEPGTVPNIKVSATGKMTWDPYPNANKYMLKIAENDGEFDTFNRTFNLNSEIDDLIKSSRIKKSSSYTIVILAYDSNYALLATGSYVYQYISSAEPVQPGVLTASISAGGILTWEAYEGAYEYHLYINGEGVYLKDGQFSIDLNKTIDKLIRTGDVIKNSTYEIYMIAFTTYSKAEWKNTYSYNSSAELVVPGTISNPSVSNGILSWDKYSGAAEYEVTLVRDDATSHFGRVNTNSFNINAKIDEAIEQGGLTKQSPYKIEILAYDSDGVNIAKCQYSYSYNSSAEYIPPKPLGTINADISDDGVLSWDQYEGAETYYVKIAGYNYWVYYTNSSLDLKKTIDVLIKNGDITKAASYNISMIADNTYGSTIAEWSGKTFTYNSPASFVSVGDISASISNGILTWKAYTGAKHYTISLANASSLTASQASSIEINKWIDRLIKEGNLEKNEYYPVEIKATDEDGITVATWSQNYKYNSSANEIVVGTISNARIANGALSWDPYPGTDRYFVYISSDGIRKYGVFLTETSYPLSDLNSKIDRCIKLKDIKKADSYFISIVAEDEDGMKLAECALSEKYAYNSPAEPIDVGTINATLTDGVLTWEAYTGTAFYGILINNDWRTSQTYDQVTTVKLKEVIASLIASGNLTEAESYSVQLYAYDSDYDTIAQWTGTIDFIRSANPMTVSPKTAKVKYKKVRKKAKKVSRSKVLNIKNANGVLSFRKLSGNKKILINAKTGEVTVKKKLKRGTYKVRVQVTSSGNGYYKGKTKTVTFKIKVK